MLENIKNAIKSDILFIEWYFSRFVTASSGSEDGRGGVLIVPSDGRNLIGAVGDDAMITAITQMRRSYFSEGDIYIITEREQAASLAKEIGLQPIEIPTGATFAFAVKKLLKKHNFSEIIILGADIMDGYYDPRYVEKILITADLGAKLGAVVNVIGFSFGLNSIPRLRKFFNKCDRRIHFNVRDRISFDRFRKFTSASPRLVADSAFLLEPGEVDSETTEWIEQQRRDGRTVVGFNIHPMLFKASTPEQLSTLVEKCAQAIKDASEVTNAAWLLLPHDYRGDIGDGTCLKPIHEALHSDPSLHVRYFDGVHRAGTLKAVAGKLDGVVTGRMHLAIAALGMGVPTLCVTYQDKFEGLFQHFDLPQEFLLSPEIFQSGNSALSVAVKTFIESLPTLRLSVESKREKVLELSARNFEL